MKDAAPSTLSASKLVPEFLQGDVALWLNKRGKSLIGHADVTCPILLASTLTWVEVRTSWWESSMHGGRCCPTCMATLHTEKYVALLGEILRDSEKHLALFTRVMNFPRYWFNITRRKMEQLVHITNIIANTQQQLEDAERLGSALAPQKDFIELLHVIKKHQEAWIEARKDLKSKRVGRVIKKHAARRIRKITNSTQRTAEDAAHSFLVEDCTLRTLSQEAGTEEAGMLLLSIWHYGEKKDGVWDGTFPEKVSRGLEANTTLEAWRYEDKHYPQAVKDIARAFLKDGIKADGAIAAAAGIEGLG